VVFTDSYSSMGNCAPLRVCLLSGNYTPRHDVYAVAGTNRGQKNLMRLVPIPNKGGLTKEHVTFADELKEAGYATEPLGVSDKPVTQYMAEAAATRAASVTEVFAAVERNEPFSAGLSRGDDRALIIEASRRPHHATLEEFKQDVLDNPLRLKQVIGSRFILTYQGCGPEAKELELNCSNQTPPKIGGAHIRHECPTFDSPWLQGGAGSGVVTLTGPISGSKTVLDFNQIERRDIK
jgi:hypothetical protein